MEVKFSAETTFNLKKRIDMVRAFMGRMYYGFLLVAGLVVCYNYYILSTGRAAAQDGTKTIALFVLMVIWAFIPVAAGFIWDKTSKVKTLRLTVYNDRVLVERDTDSFELDPHRFYTVAEKEDYIKFGPLKNTVIVDKKEMTSGEGDKLAAFLIDMKNRE